MDKNMSQTKNNSTAARELGHQKSETILGETNFDEDSGLGVSGLGYSYDYSLDKDNAKSKGPHGTSKQKQQQEEPDYLDSGFESGIQSGPIDSKQMVQIPLDKFKGMHLTDSKKKYPEDQLPNSKIIQEIFRQDEDGDT